MFTKFVLSTSLCDCVFVGLSPLTNDAFVLTACWWRQYDRFSLMVTLCENCVLITSHEKYGAESPWTQAKQTVKQHVNNWGLAATIIHHHLSSVSQCQTPRPLHPEPLIPFCNASSNFLGSHAKSVLRHAFSHARRNTSETTAIHQNANSDRQSLPFFSCNKLIFTSFHDCVINLKCSQMAWNFILLIYLFIGRGQMRETLLHENVQSRCHACRIRAMAELQLLVPAWASI